MEQGVTVLEAENGYIAPPFLTLVLYGGEWLVSRPIRFNPGERAHNIHCVGGWVDPVGERKIILPSMESKPNQSAICFVNRRLIFTPQFA
jgi:hypothetical protein